VSNAITELPVLDDDPFSDELLADPYGFQQRLRDAGPVVRLSRYSVLAMGRYEEVRAALVDWETFISSRGVGVTDPAADKPWRPPSLLLEADPPDHTVVRRAMDGIISPRSVRALRATFAPFADELAETLVDMGSFDAITDLAEVYPLRVFPDAIGIRSDGRENLLPYGSLAFNANGPANELFTNALAAAGSVQEWINESCQREQLASDGLGARIWEAADRGEVTHEQAPLLVRSLLTAGFDTTVHGISSSIYALASHPGQWEQLHAEPTLAKFAFDEALRFASPVQVFHRVAARDAQVAGASITAGTRVYLSLASANRDPRKWGKDADQFNIRRSASGHVAFGMGIHQCIGQPIARLETELILTALARRGRQLVFNGEPQVKLNNSLRGWSSMPVTVTPA
jgi:cytochrome P450